jgi:3-hydroxy acid dehydrogenase/malonic semialdehyde reductase
MSTPLFGKAVLVTGASAGIGRATAVALAQAGAKIVATGRRKLELDALAKQCGGQTIETIVGDLNDAGFVDDLVKRTRDVDILVNNAGILKYAPLMDITDADCEEMFRTNVLASFRVTLAVAKSMVERRRGHIIVMTSIAAREVYRLGVIYCATKHALSAFARGLRIELQSLGIKVTEIAPGDGGYRNSCQQRSP